MAKPRSHCTEEEREKKRKKKEKTIHFLTRMFLHSFVH